MMLHTAQVWRLSRNPRLLPMRHSGSVIIVWHLSCRLPHLDIAEVPLAKELCLNKRLLHCRRCCRQLCVGHDGQMWFLPLLRPKVLVSLLDVCPDGQPPGALYRTIPFMVRVLKPDTRSDIISMLPTSHSARVLGQTRERFGG